MTQMKLTAFGVSLLGTFLLILLYFLGSQSILLRNLEAKALDLRFHLRGGKTPDPRLVLVVIDDRSIAELGRWPWSRRSFGEVVKRLQEAGARVVAFDLLFTESEAAVERDVLHRLRQTVESSDLFSTETNSEAFRQILLHIEQSVDPDQAFAATLRESGNVVLAFAMTVRPPSPQGQPTQRPFSPFITGSAYRTLQYWGSAKPPLPLAATALLLPIETIGQAAAALGHVNVALDTDGTPRYEYPVVEYRGVYYPSFAVQVAREYLGWKLEEMRVQFGEGIQLGSIFIPTDESMRMLVNYVGAPGTFPAYSFVDVLQGRLPNSTFKDTLVLIGGVASGVADTFVTPFSTALPGVERHATVIDNILREDFLYRRHATAIIDLACIVILGLLVGWLSLKCPSFWGSIIALGVAGVYVTVNLYAFAYAGLWVNLLFPVGAVVLNHSTITLHRFLTEERQKRLIRQAFQHYLHPAVVDQVSQNPQLLKLGGEARDLTVLFSDIRGFSAIAERLPPEELVRLLNEYFTVMTQAVFKHNGLLDKYVGDAVMAVYGAPLHIPEHAYQACRTALDMVIALKGLQARWQERGLPHLNIGIGINTGLMVVGNMGSEQRFDYTVIGDGVNLASRLEGANKEYGTNIIISESTWAQVKDRIATREIDVIRVPGKVQPTRIFEVLGLHPLSPAQVSMLTVFEMGLYAYRAQKWEDAIGFFQQALDRAPGDTLSELYLRRCGMLMASPPPLAWDGVYAVHAK